MYIYIYIGIDMNISIHQYMICVCVCTHNQEKRTLSRSSGLSRMPWQRCKARGYRAARVLGGSRV